MDEPVASFGHPVSGDKPTNTNRLLGAFGDVTGEETGNAASMVEEWPIRRLGLRDCTFGGLASMIRALAMMVRIHYMWLSFGSSLYARVVAKTAPDIFGGITGAEDGLALITGPVAEWWNDGSNGFVNVLVESGASVHNFYDAIISELQDKLDNYQALAIQRGIATLGGPHLMETG